MSLRSEMNSGTSSATNFDRFMSRNVRISSSDSPYRVCVRLVNFVDLGDLVCLFRSCRPVNLVDLVDLVISLVSSTSSI